MIDGFAFGLGAVVGAVIGMAIVICGVVAINWVVEQFK